MKTRAMQEPVRLLDHNGLSIEQVRAFAPSVYAEQAWEECSDQYAFVSTGLIDTHLRDNGYVPTQVAYSRTKKDGMKAHVAHMLRYRAMDQLGEPAPDLFELVLYNSSNRASSVLFAGGVIRIACENGMLDGSFAGAFKAMHRGDPNAILTRVWEVIETAPRIMDKVETMSQIYLSRAEQLAFAEAAIQVRFGSPDEEVIEGEFREVDAVPQSQPAPSTALTVYQPHDFLVVHRDADRGNDLWTTVNRVQENMLRPAGFVSRRGRDGRRHTLKGISSIGSDLRINKGLWLLAEKMMELKA